MARCLFFVFWELAYASSEVLLEHPVSALIFALLFKGYGLPYSIMVVRQILVLFVEVRILVGQRRPLAIARGFFLW